MSAASAQAAIAVLAQETARRERDVPRSLWGEALAAGRYQINADAFLLHTDTGLWLHYQRGAGVAVELPAAVPAGELELWLRGSVHAAAAALNGLLPIHASAVAHKGRVFAISGPSGAGKSTLAAGLGHKGLPLFCDDTLLLDLSDPAAIWCLPGHKRLKLDEAALGLTGAERREQVGAMIDKFYAEPPGGTMGEPLPLAALLVLEDGASFTTAPIAGGERIARLNDDHYTADYYAAARQLDPAGRFAHFASIAPRIAMHRLARPRSGAAFAQTIASFASWIGAYLK
jgi:hypothetical protein